MCHGEVLIAVVESAKGIFTGKQFIEHSLPCSIVGGLCRRTEVFLRILKWVEKMALWNFGNLALKFESILP